MPTLEPKIDYRLAMASDRCTIAALLEAEGLPATDLAASGVLLILAHEDGRFAGVVGIEPCGRTGLIRSLAVAPEFRGRGIGRALVEHAERLAAAGGLHTLYLLTEKATAFWTRCGYATMPRADVPAEIRESAQFALLCPASAICMRRALLGPSESAID
jgi:N-acetylglutamate synthase-like GNAT family acetyltransferase